MALVALPRELLMISRDHPFSIGSTVMDAVGESTAYIGTLHLSTGAGTSKVISSAGGKIYFANQTVVFANAGSNLRVGIQDVGATGIEDGTFDVFADLVPGTDTVASDTFATATMSSGTKTIADGDLIAVVIEWTARAGTDAVRPQRNDPVATNFPYCTIDTGAGPAKSTTLPICTIEFDDGTIGHFGPTTGLFVGTPVTFNSGSTPDEYALIFQVPFSCEIGGLAAFIGDIDAGDDGELILYSDPLGTPVAERTFVHDGDFAGQVAAVASLSVFPITPFTLLINTNYAVAYRPTNTNNRVLGLFVIPTAASRAVFAFGTTAQGGTRTNQTGAFGSLSSTSIPAMGICITKLPDDAGGGSGGVNRALLPAGVSALG